MRSLGKRERLSNWNVVLIRKGETQEFSALSLHALPHTLQRKGPNKRAAICKLRRELPLEPNQPIPWSRTSNLQKYDKINFCCLSLSVCNILLQQLELTDTHSKAGPQESDIVSGSFFLYGWRQNTGREEFPTGGRVKITQCCDYKI